MIKRNFIKIILLLTLFFISIGYASLNTVLEMSGNVVIERYNGVIITDIVSEDVDLDEKASINGFDVTDFNLKVVLANSTDSRIAYKIKVFNNSIYYYKFMDIINKNYDNENIVYYLNGLELYDVLAPAETREFYIVFKYKNDEICLNKELNAFINFNFEKVTKEIKFADKVKTAEYSLNVMNDMLDRVIDLIPKINYEGMGELDKKIILSEINELLSEVKWIYDYTKLYDTHMFSKTDFDNIYVGEELLQINLERLDTNFIEKATFEQLDLLEEVCQRQKEVIIGDLEEITQIKTSLDVSEINGHNHLNYLLEEINFDISLMQTIEGNLTEVHDMAQRMRYLSIEAANEETNDKVLALNLEFQQLILEIYRIIDGPCFDGMAIANGFSFILNGRERKIEEFDKTILNSLNEDLTKDNAELYSDIVWSFIEQLGTLRAKIGNYQNVASIYGWNLE